MPFSHSPCGPVGRAGAPIPLSLSRRARRWWTLLGLAALLAEPALAATQSETDVAAPSVAVAPAELSPASHELLIEKITVEGNHRVAASLIVNESLLVAGQRYRESDLRQAVYRLHRLPFLLDADFALKTGSVRGAYELVITVRETRLVFLGSDVRHYIFARDLGLDGGDEGGVLTASNTAGIRHFLGKDAMVFATIDDRQGLQLGATHYNLFDRHIFATAATSAYFACCTEEIFPLGLDPLFTTWSLDGARRISVDVGFPLAGRQTLRFSASRLDADGATREPVLLDPGLPDGERFHSFGPLTEHYAELRWIYDTTDDPLVPRRGREVYAGAFAATLESERDDVSRADTAARMLDTRLIGGVGSFRQYWPISTRDSMSLGVRVVSALSVLEGVADAAADIPAGDELTSLEARLEAGYAIDFIRGAMARDHGNLRLEFRTGVGYEGLLPDFDLRSTPLRRWDVTVLLTFRNSWGVFRAGIYFVDFDEVNS